MDNNKQNRMMIATMALQGMLASGKVAVGDSNAKTVKTSIAYADEMIKQLESEQNDNSGEQTAAS